MPLPAQIKKIHALKGALKLDDDTYRAMLGGYGVKTSTKLSITRADQLIADLEQKAVAAQVWEKRKPAAKAKATRKLADDSQSRMIRECGSICTSWAWCAIRARRPWPPMSSA